jgi:hypothetical protein
MYGEVILCCVVVLMNVTLCRPVLCQQPVTCQFLEHLYTRKPEGCMNCYTNLECDMAQVVSYRHFTSETHALSQENACGVIGVQSNIVGGLS